MPYVMVPVPEEHVESVMQFVLRAMARASIKPWDQESVENVWTGTDEATRSLLSFVARAAAEGLDISDVDLAARIQMSARETLGILNELNAKTREDDRDNLVTTKVVDERLPNGRVTNKRVFQMSAEIAELVRAVERAEAGSLPSLDSTG